MSKFILSFDNKNDDDDRFEVDISYVFAYQKMSNDFIIDINPFFAYLSFSMISLVFVCVWASNVYLQRISSHFEEEKNKIDEINTVAATNLNPINWINRLTIETDFRQNKMKTFFSWVRFKCEICTFRMKNAWNYIDVDLYYVR